MAKNIFSKPILFITLGFPGSGKTFFARRFAKDMGLFHLNADRLWPEIFPEPKYSLSTERKAVFRTMDYIAGELLRQGVSVAYDANINKRIFRKRLQKIAKGNGAGYALLWFQVPIEIALKRIGARRNLKSDKSDPYQVAVQDEILYRMKNEEEAPIKEKHLVIDGRLPYLKQKKVVINFLKTFQHR